MKSHPAKCPRSPGNIRSETKSALHCFVFLTHLQCAACGLRHDWSCLQNLCTACQKPLLAIYDLPAAGRALDRGALEIRDKSLWRYRELLPLPLEVEPVSLGEGGTPLIHAAKFGPGLGFSDLWVKDESQNPTQSFKARGMSVAVSMAKHLGATRLAVPSAGNAGGALAAYAARAGLEAHIFMPRDTPRANVIECREFGAQVTLIDGLITDCGAEIARRKSEEGWFDVSTLKEPYRIEGKKTLGYELAEQLNWELPDVILYPTGGGTGLIGMWKAFEEMEAPRLDRPKASPDVFGSGQRLRPNRSGVRIRRIRRNRISQSAHLRLWPPRSESNRRFPYSRHSPPIQGRRDCGGRSGHDRRRLARSAQPKVFLFAPEGAACFAALEPLFRRARSLLKKRS